MSADDLLLFVWVLACRDISFLCDALVSHKKTPPLPLPLPLPPLAGRSGAGRGEVRPRS